MKIKIAGINGYLGPLISQKMTEKGYNVSGIRRELLYDSTEKLSNEIKGCDIIINLAGAPILKRWTKNNKALIYNSRIETSRNLVQAINTLKPEKQPQKFISASAIGIYKSGLEHDENSRNLDAGFLGTVVKEWEQTLQDLPKSIQTNIFRIGLVLGKNSKTISNLLVPFKLGLGGKIGSGKQAFPFIHEKDLVKAFVWAVESCNKSGICNLVAPENITNADFTKAFAKKLNRPAIVPVPAFAIKLILGEASVLLLESPIVNPKALLDVGFNFEYPTIEKTFEEILA